MTTTTPSTNRIFSLWDAVSLPSAVNAAVAAVVAVVLAAVTAALALSGPTSYQSRATIAIDQPQAIAKSADAGVIEKLDRLRLKYAGLATTAPLVDPIASRLHLPAGVVRSQVTVGVGPESLLLHPTATAATPRQARELAQAMATELGRYAAREQAAAGIAPSDRYEFSVVERAGDGAKVGPSRRKAVASAAFAALVALGLAYVALQVVTANRRLQRP